MTATLYAFLWNKTMQVKVIDENKKFNIRFPTWLLFNRFFASLAPLFINKNFKGANIKLTGPMCRKFVRGFYKTRKRFGKKLELVEVETKDGTYVKIVL